MKWSEMPVKIRSAEFAGAALSLAALPEWDGAEVAVVGRSNVGKSTLINRLTGRRKLARTSSEPGRTRELNLFKVALTIDETASTVMLVDLPGFGYARFSKEQREQLSLLTVDYLSRRESLKVVCLLNDARREPQSDELAVRDLAFRHGRHLLVVLTKMDKLNQSERAKRPRAIAEQYGLEPADLAAAGEGVSVESLWERVLQVL